MGQLVLPRAGYLELGQRSKSSGDLTLPFLSSESCVEELLDEILSMAVVEKSPQDDTIPKGKTKPRICHQCHAPVEQPDHEGVPCGVGRCSLPHWQGCDGTIEGGKDGKGKTWAACQDIVTTEESESETDDEEIKTKSKKLPATVKEAAKQIESGLANTEDGDSSTDDEELLQQQEELDRMQREIDQQSLLAIARAARVAEKEQKRAQKKQELDRQMQILKDKQAALSAPSSAGTATTPGSGGGPPPTETTLSNVLKSKVADYESKKNRKAAEKRAKSNATGLTMGGIRAIPDVRKEVEGYISHLKSIIPTLSSDPTAGGFDTSTFQPGSINSSSGAAAAAAGNTDTTRYVYVAELGQAIPVVGTLKDLPTVTKESSRPVPGISESSDSDSECSADESCLMYPEPGMRFLWKKHDNGRKFFKPVPLETESTEMVLTYQYDKVTGNYEQRLVPKELQVKKKKKLKKASSRRSETVLAANTPVYKDHRVGNTRVVKDPARKEERQPSFVSGDPEKQGKESRIPTLVQFARDCPVSWTNKVTTTSLNPILFSWAYIAELLATRTGQAPSLQGGELEARLQHFLSVLEVTLQTTTQTDFSSDSWKVARLYNQKVQDKVDAGVYTWLELAQQWGTATLPHELMAANAELAPRILKKRFGERTPPKKKEEERKPGLCYSWNNSETRGKCKWEVENDGRKCNKQHYCSWCKGESNKINFHQELFCKKKQLEKEGE